MAPRHPRETILAAIVDHRRGDKSPVVCHRYRISERTLYRWLRMAARDAGDPREGAEPLLCGAAPTGDE